MATPPKQKPGRSRQNYGTPPDLLDAVRGGLGIEAFGWDFAASAENAVCRSFYTEADDALTQPWSVLTAAGDWGWCNPPFARIEPWVRKAWTEYAEWGVKTAMLLPAAVGSNWWRDWVHHKAAVRFLNPRVTFAGCTTPYPKDCVTIYYGLAPTYAPWRWKRQMELHGNRD